MNDLVSLKRVEEFHYGTPSGQGRNHRLLIVRQKRCDEFLDPLVVGDSKKGVNSVSFDAEARPQQNKIADVGPEGNDALAFAEG
jgi:hypothetical protein